MSSKSADERFRDDLESRYEKLIERVDEALESTKKVRVFNDCDKCGCRHAVMLDVPNEKQYQWAAEFLANRGIGRPGTVEPGEREIVHEYRFEYVMPSGVGS